ncbi:MAG: DUF4920 domain-containing protein [Polyangiaceae bacterium]|nr:DUF4920 domain-containing protein [Polyangiaceae bacterium]
MIKKLLLALALSGCNGGAPAAKESAAPVVSASASPRVAAQAERYGDAITAGATRVDLAELVKHPAAYADKRVVTEGKVTSVCQGKGCWLELGDEAGSAHVKLGGHKFFVPRSSSGKTAVVEATVLPQVDTGHCEQEAEEQTGRVAKVELVATGVELSTR